MNKHRDPHGTRLRRYHRIVLSSQRLDPASILSLIDNASPVVETVIHGVGHQMLEQILELSAARVVGERTPGKASGSPV